MFAVLGCWSVSTTHKSPDSNVCSVAPVVEIFKDGVGKVNLVSTAGRYFLRVSVNGCEKIFERTLDAPKSTCDDGLATTNRDTCCRACSLRRR